MAAATEAGALERALAQAERSRLAEYRAEAEAQARTSTAWKVPTHPPQPSQ